MADIVELVKAFEGFKSRRYTDLAGVPTIGYGDTELASTRDVISPQEAGEELERKLARLCDRLYADFQSASQASLTTRASPCVVEATASLAYNIGYARARYSSWWRTYARDGDVRVDALLRWHKVGQQRVYGLLRRRAAEAFHALGANWRLVNKMGNRMRRYIETPTPSLLMEIANEIHELARTS